MLVQLLEVVLLAAIVGLDEVDGAAELGVDAAHFFGLGLKSGIHSNLINKVHFLRLRGCEISRGYFSSGWPPVTKRPKLFREEFF